ncbi:hypothetical protein CRG98_013628 [Punica granatum]|uniref:Uncharacterized protein n=1 Tax=Punica granatum TaxID=22663 RepID=A0A2I0KBS5_PUNGR|nr:hypothetical protein CRG98_013628 [Punica granatum]
MATITLETTLEGAMATGGRAQASLPSPTLPPCFKIGRDSGDHAWRGVAWSSNSGDHVGKGDGRNSMVRKGGERWPRVEIVNSLDSRGLGILLTPLDVALTLVTTPRLESPATSGVTDDPNQGVVIRMEAPTWASAPFRFSFF